MKLYLNKASPYARLALATAHEAALADMLRRLGPGELAVAVAFDYADFRLPEIAWRTQSPGLAAWVDAVCARPSMQATRPR